MFPTQAPTPSSHPHLCDKCALAFATRKALKDHSWSTGHGFPCTAPRCKKAFLSTAALQAHLSSAAHRPPVPTSIRRAPVNDETLAASGPGCGSTLGNQDVQLFKCTVSGCGKSFNSKTSRGQHLNCSIHRGFLQAKGKSVMMCGEAQNGVKTGATGGLLGASDVGKAQQPTQLKITKPIAVTTTGIHSAVVTEQEASSVQSTAVPEKKVNATKGKQKPISASQKAPGLPSTQRSTSLAHTAQVDSRWSVIPAVQYASAVTALDSRVTKTVTNKTTTKFSTIGSTTAPSHSTTVRRRHAVALDCEMVRISSNVSELARISAIDYLTGEILIDTLVQPLHHVTDWRTQWSGVTAQAMNAAVKSGTALRGAPEARTKLFEYIDTETILVGHALHHDLAALGIHHQKTVDSAMLAQKAVAMGARKQWGLKALCKEFLELTVQDHGNAGHDSVEDAFAAREVVLWCLQNPDELKAWGERKKAEILAEDRIRKAKKNARAPARASRLVYDYSDEFDYSDGSEVLHLSLEEFNEMCGYPSWYDNWSD